MDIRDVSREGRSLPHRKRPSRKSLLKKDDIRAVTKSIALKLNKLRRSGDATDVPGEYVQLHIKADPFPWNEETVGWRKRSDWQTDQGLGGTQTASPPDWQECPLSQPGW